MTATDLPELIANLKLTMFEIANRINIFNQEFGGRTNSSLQPQTVIIKKEL